MWHSVSINARRDRVTLTLDNDAASPTQDTTRIQIYSGNSYYFGGKRLSAEVENQGGREKALGNYFPGRILPWLSDHSFNAQGHPLARRTHPTPETWEARSRLAVQM